MTNERPILGVDLDGVCADYEDALRHSVATRRGVEPASLPPQTEFDAYSQWGLDATGFEQAHRVAVAEDRIFRTMQPFPDVAQTLWQLSDDGVWIRIITHRLLFNGLHEISAADTAWWLDHHDIPYRDLCFIGDKPDVGADLYVDDHPGIIAELRDQGRQVVVFDQAYNRTFDGPRIVHWQQMPAMLTSLAETSGS